MHFFFFFFFFFRQNTKREVRALVGYACSSYLTAPLVRKAGASYDRFSDTEIDETTPLALSPSPKVGHISSPPSPVNVRVTEAQQPVRAWRDTADGVVNLVNSIIGGGMLALPFAIKNCGLVVGSLLVVLFFVICSYTGQLLIKCAMPPLSGGTTYSQLAQKTLGGPGRVFVECCLILFLVGTLVGYLVIIGDVLTPYLNMAFAVDRRVVMLFFGILVCFPLSSLPRISLLKYTSFVALVFIFYLVGCVVVASIVGMTAPGFDPSRIVLANFSGELLAVLPIISFAFTFHTNVPPIWADMTEYPLSSKSINLSIFVSCAICSVIYLMCGIFGYLTFFELTSDNILTHYPASAWYFDIGKIGYSVIIMFSYPLLAFPMRVAIDALINAFFYKDLDRPVSHFRRILESFVIFAFSYGMAILPIGIGVVFGISGATVGNMVVIGLPCIFFIILDVDPRESADNFRKPWWFYRVFSWRKAVPVSLLVISLVLTVTGMFSVIAFNLLPSFEKNIGQT